MKFAVQDAKRALTCKGNMVACFALCVIFIHAIRTNVNLDEPVNTYEIIVAAMALSGFTPFAAVFATMGYACRFCDEYHSGYIQMIISRDGWKKYGIIRMITTGVAGGVTISIPFFLVCVFAYVYGTHGMIHNMVYVGKRAEYYLENYGDIYVLGCKVLLGFIFGATWALVGMAFSVWFCNRYVSLIAPFVLYDIMWLMLYNVRIINPIFLIRGDDLNSYPLSICMEIVYLMLAVGIMWLGLYRRMQNE